MTAAGALIEAGISTDTMMIVGAALTKARRVEVQMATTTAGTATASEAVNEALGV